MCYDAYSVCINFTLILIHAGYLLFAQVDPDVSSLLLTQLNVIKLTICSTSVPMQGPMSVYSSHNQQQSK